MLLRGFRLFGVALHREPKGTKRNKPLLKRKSRFKLLQLLRQNRAQIQLQREVKPE